MFDFPTAQQDVDRHTDRTKVVQCEEDFNPFDAVAKQDRHTISVLDTDRVKTVRKAFHPLTHFVEINVAGTEGHGYVPASGDSESMPEKN